ncbi:MAG: hypothetical protein WC091_17670 [Sulfuricellaceae bacterium]
MDNHADFRFNHARHSAAAALQPQHIPDFQRLVKDLRFGSRFQFLIAEFNDVPYREALIRQIDEVLAAEKLRSTRLVLSRETQPDFATVEADLRRLTAEYQAIHVIGGESWFDDARWQAFNIRREAVAQAVPLRLIFWLTTAPISRLAQLAPDLWAWRGGIFSFTVAAVPIYEAPVPRNDPVDPRPMAERSKRIATLRAYLQNSPADDLCLPLLNEMAELYFRLGDLDEALRILKQELLPLCEKLGNVCATAVTHGKIADILEARGELDEALRIREQEELPVYEKLGDVRLVAVVRGQIADILEARGELDVALRIRELEELPVYEKLGDVRSAAVTRSLIADILQARGELDVALRICKQEVLPVFEELGDVRSAAITRGKIAGILQARGELDEALRIREQEELPVYEGLGDTHSTALTRANIADILQARGERDIALCILEREVLPVLEKIGDMRNAAIVRDRIVTLQAQIAAQLTPTSSDNPPTCAD